MNRLAVHPIQLQTAINHKTVDIQQLAAAVSQAVRFPAGLLSHLNMTLKAFGQTDPGS